MTEIQGKSILVRVSARFELARVRVIGSRLSLFKFIRSPCKLKAVFQADCPLFPLILINNINKEFQRHFLTI